MLLIYRRTIADCEHNFRSAPQSYNVIFSVNNRKYGIKISSRLNE